MQWKEWFNKRFGIDVDAEMPDDTKTEPKDKQTEEPKDKQTEEPKDKDTDASTKALLEQINQLKSVNEQLTKMNQSLALSAKAEPEKTSEEILRDAFGEKENK